MHYGLLCSVLTGTHDIQNGSIITNDNGTHIVCNFASFTLKAIGCFIIVYPTQFNKTDSLHAPGPEETYYQTLYRIHGEASASTTIETGLPAGYYTLLLYEIDGGNLPERFPAFLHHTWIPSIVQTDNFNAKSLVNITASESQICVACSFHSSGRGFITVYHPWDEDNITTLYHVLLSRNQLAQQKYCFLVLPGCYSVAVFGISGNDISRIDHLPSKIESVIISESIPSIVTINEYLLLLQIIKLLFSPRKPC